MKAAFDAAAAALMAGGVKAAAASKRLAVSTGNSIKEVVTPRPRAVPAVTPAATMATPKESRNVFLRVRNA